MPTLLAKQTKSIHVLYLSYLFQNPSSIIGSYVLITIYLLLNLLPDEHTDRKHRFRLAMYAPIAYFIFYIMNLIQLAAIVRCVFKGNKLLSRQKVKATWRSPERSGAAHVSFSKTLA